MLQLLVMTTIYISRVKSVPFRKGNLSFSKTLAIKKM
jgi:hypothetical protein